MKILLFFEGEELIKTSGIGRAMKHQIAALESQGIEYTTEVWDEDYDILHINTYGLASEGVILNARRLGKKVIYHAHSTEEDFRNSFILSNQIAPLFKQYLVTLYSQADALITPTPYSKKIIEGYEGINLPIYAISNGIDINRYAYNAEKVKAFRRYFDIRENDKVIISVGLYFERKGILDFVEVAKKMPDYRFIWFGHTNLLTVPQEIREVVENHPDNVLFPGYIKGPIIEGAYLGADCFFFPSYEETEGIVVLEALASHQQVVVRDIGAFDPWLQDKVNCYKGHDNDEFADILDKVISGEYPSTREEGFKVAEARSIDNIGKQLKEVYETVLGEGVEKK